MPLLLQVFQICVEHKKPPRRRRNNTYRLGRVVMVGGGFPLNANEPK